MGVGTYKKSELWLDIGVLIFEALNYFLVQYVNYLWIFVLFILPPILLKMINLGDNLPRISIAPALWLHKPYLLPS